MALSALPAESVEPLLGRLVPSMLLWCSNKHPHLKTQVRYLMERLVKRFGHEAMTEVTPDAHQRLLTHLRKQKAYAHNKAVERREEAAARRGGGGGEEEGGHDEYEALLDESDGEGGEGGEGDAGGEGGEGGAVGMEGVEGGAGAAGGRKGAASGVRRPRRIARPDGGVRSTWMDQGQGAAGLDLLSAPLVPLGPGATAGAAPAQGGGSRAAGGKRGRGREAEEADGSVRIDEEGKLVVREGAAAEPEGASRFAGGHHMEVDPQDEIVRVGAKRRKGAHKGVIQASAAEEAEAAAEKAAKGKPGRASLSALKHGKKGAWHQGADGFGAQLGEQYASKKGAAGDVIRNGAPAPYAYLPLNPRLLGKKQQRKAKVTMGKLVRPSKSGGAKVAKGGRVGKHGLQARRGKGSKGKK